MPEQGSPEVVLSFGDYLSYYDLEQYLFEQVGPRFHSEHSIGAFDFFSIVIWKANRAKSKIAERLRRKAQPGEDLDAIARRLTASLYGARDACERLRLLLDEKEWGFRLPMASAVLTVLWPEEFTVYDFRACEQRSPRTPQPGAPLRYAPATHRRNRKVIHRPPLSGERLL
jgi:hypothetical protein